jgi:hypothetical protein
VDVVEEIAGVAVLTVDGVVGRGVEVEVVERDGRLFDRCSGVELDYVSVVVFVPVAA